MNQTEEQEAIVRHCIKRGELVKINAFAGTGKTSTLEMVARANKHIRFLYLAFNKPVQKEAEERFPKNVTCKTNHGLAFRGFGSQVKGRLVSSLKAKTVMDAYHMKDYWYANYTIQTFQNYLISADLKIQKDHIPHEVEFYYKRELKSESEAAKMINKIIESADQLLHDMYYGGNPAIGCLHDCYLKFYALSEPDLSYYDVVLLDEAQDTNPVMKGIIFNQKNKNVTKIVCGDSHQQIYTWRGAVDFLKKLEGVQYNLTCSFRFDNDIARLANMILAIFKNESLKLKGMRDNSNKEDFNGSKYTYISRTNAEIFKTAASLYQHKAIGFLGGIHGYRFQDILDVYNLKQGRSENIINPFIRNFESFVHLEGYADSVKDFQILSTCSVVKNYDNAIPSLVEKIRTAAVPETDAEILFTTAHKAKGSQWDNVYMAADDFPEIVKNGKIINPDSLPAEEFNLYYVAVTRAKKNLRFPANSSFGQFIKLAEKEKECK
ncbi:MAG: UvrD-helicase domain-containing protein [Desulfobacterales bacterium]